MTSTAGMGDAYHQVAVLCAQGEDPVVALDAQSVWLVLQPTVEDPEEHGYAKRKKGRHGDMELDTQPHRHTDRKIEKYKGAGS